MVKQHHQQIMENFVPHSSSSSSINQPHVITDSFAMPTFTHQYATPVFLSFPPPPPCPPGPLDYTQQLTNSNQDAAPNAVAAGMGQIFVHRIGEINSSQQSCAPQTNDRVVKMADAFTALNMNDSHSTVSRPDSTGSTGTSILDYHIPPSYSVVLPSATIVHHLGANVYQQFSPVIAQNVPQIHPVYPLDPGSHPAVTTNIIATQPEAPWPVHPPPMSANPSPLFWSQYVHNPDKNHNIPLSSQPFLRRHSICEEPAVTPTNVCPPCNLTGIVSATPEFIHPRKPDVPQWLMSPPVGDQDPSIISYAPMMYRNVRGVPSVTGIAIPLVTQVNVESPLSAAEPPKLPSPMLISSPLPCYEGTVEIQGSNNLQPKIASSETAVQSGIVMSPVSVAEQGLTGPQPLKRVVELQQSQCWQCVAGDKTPDVKHPPPDLFNRWPNIPPPPPPPQEAEDCSNEAMALATALFPSDSNECCLHNCSVNQEDDVLLQQTYPIGVFWDIENCAVPTGKSAHSIVKRVRERFFAGHKEAEFMCVCDINKESKQIVQDLNNAQVNVVHISATAKNAADDKLRQSIRRFAHNHPAPATLVLITGDNNFTSEVSDLRHRHKYFVVLIHPTNSSQALLQAATTVICYEQLVADLPVINYSPKDSQELQFQQILVANLPRDGDPNAIRNRLRRLSENCGGKVVKVSPGTAVLRFASKEAASRAMKRLDGENILGNSISVCVLHQSPRKGISGGNANVNRNVSNNNSMLTHQIQKESVYGEPSNTGYRIRPDGSQNYNVRPMINLTPGHCDPPGCVRPFYQPSQQITPAEPATTFSFYPSPILHPVSMQCNHPSQIIAHHGYNSMPPPPQPQLFQNLSHHQDKEEMQNYGVKLTISNIDAQLGITAIQDTICKSIVQHCQILDMRVRPHNRFTVVCDVTVPHVTDASRVLQHLQRQKIGTKRVLVTLTQQGGDDVTAEDYSALKRDCFSILKDCGVRGMQLFKFLTLYEKRYHRKAKLDDIHSISDVVFVHDGPAGTVISINPKIRDEHMLEQHIASLPRSGRSTPDLNHDFLLPVCKLHYPADDTRPASGEGGLLKIEIGLREFSAKLHALLHTHNGILQLDGFEYCYRAEYGNFPLPQNIHEGGVFVEHQSSYVPGVQIITSQPHCLGVKAIVWAQPQSDAGSDTASDTSGATRWKSPNLIQFSREVVELLKERPYCCLPYDNFSSAYHRHFGHACRVAEYGFTRLSDLLAAIPHVLQVMGSLSNRVLTLTHRAQVKRFTQEVVKILKSTPDRAILVAQMPELYNRSFNRVWKLRDYGVSVLSDLLDDIPEGHICTNGEGDNIVLSLPVRERTADEKERTGQFAREVIKILRSRPHYRMPFTDFVPTYHRQFGRQCKLANYGFSKLIDLFEALPQIVQIFEKGTEKFLALTEMEQKKVLSMQIISLLRAQQVPTFPPTLTKEPPKSTVDGPTLPLACMHVLFQQKYNFPLLPREFGANDIEDLMRKLSHAVKVGIGKCGEKVIRLSDRKPLRLLSAQLLALLLDQSTDHFDVDHLHSLYVERYKENVVPDEYGFLSLSDVIRKALPGVIKMDIDASECFICLKSLYQEARKIRSILLDNNCCMTLGEFSIAFRNKYGTIIDHENQGFPTMESLFRALPNILVVKGFGMKKTVTLRNHMQYGPLSGTMGNNCGQNFANGNSRDSIQAASGDSYSCFNKQTSRGLNNSASTGDFRSEGEQQRKATGLCTSDHPSSTWIPPTRPLAPTYQNSKCYFQNGKSRNCTKNLISTSNRYSRSKTSALGLHTSCKFSIGGASISTSIRQEYNEDQTPIRRGISMSVITLPSGSTPIASTSSCSSTSTRESVGSSASSECSIESVDSFSSDEECPTHPGSVLSGADKQCQGPSSLPNSPFASITGATAFVGPLPHVRNGCLQNDSNSPGRMQLAASFPTLAHI